ncbi:MAG: hypothetical protein RL277_1592 [Planctomycetota bacterium]|jgi:hypothetical protein
MWLAALLLCVSSGVQDAPTPCDVLIVGGSLGGCAAAIGAEGLDVWMVEDSDWIGGQVTSQGVSALDEHRLIESFGGTREYMQFRAGVRRRSGGVANPGGGWVSRLCFEPRVGLAELEERLARSGTRILREARVVRAEVHEDRVREVSILDREGREIRLAPRLVLEASDTGEFYPLAGIEHRLGSDAKSETREAHAKDVADPLRQQSYTYPFAVEWRPGESHVIEKPEGYERFRDSQPYTLDIMAASGSIMSFGFFEKREGSPGPFWTYRRIAPTIAMINWPGNDYRGAPLIGGDTLEAKRLSLGFLYWLQTECPRDDGGKGYPELLLRKDIMGSEDGLSKRPYVREPRRLVARTIVHEEDLLPETARARLFRDSIGLGWYPIDVHACSNERKDSGGLGIPTKPFQVPLGSLLPLRMRNVVAAGKAIGVSHVTNGAYRLHPIEWSIGEAAGQLARFALARGVEPAQVREQSALLEAFQRELLERGMPVFWFSDLKDGSEEWQAAQWLAVRGELDFDASKLELGFTEARRAQLVERWKTARR